MRFYSIEILRMLGHRSVVSAGLSAGLVCLLAGCGPRVRSALAGTWTISQMRNQEFGTDGELRSDSTSHADSNEQRVFLVIRSNGTFDWGHTMLAMHPQAAGLHRTGQRATCIERGARGTLKLTDVAVEDADYTEQVSRIVIHQHDHSTGLHSTFLAEAALQGDGRAAFHIEMTRPDSRTVQTGVLRRLDHEPLTPIQQYLKAGSASPVGEVRHFRVVSLDAAVMVVFPDKRRILVMGARAGRPLLYDLETAKCIRKFSTDGERIADLAVSPDGKYVAGSLFGANGDLSRKRYGIYLWDPESGDVVLRLKGLDCIRLLAFSPCGKYLLEAGSYNADFNDIDRMLNRVVMQLWDVEDRRIVRQYRGSMSVQNVAFFQDGRRLLASSPEANRALAIWDWTTGELLQTIDKTHPRWEELPADSPENGSIAASTRGTLFAGRTFGRQIGRLAIADVDDMANPRSLRGQFDPGNQISNLVWSSDDARLLSADYQGRLILWDVLSGEPVAEFHAPKGFNFGCVDFIDHDQAVTSGHDGVVRVWQLPPHPVATENASE